MAGDSPSGLRLDATPDPERLRGVHEAVARARATLRKLTADQWPEGLRVIDALVDRTGQLTRGRVTLDGRSEADLFREYLERSVGAENAAAMFRSHTDAEVLLGLVGFDGSRSRVLGWETEDRGRALFTEAFERIVQAADAVERPPEGVAWSMAVIDRVARGKLEAEFLPLAVRLLRISAGDAAPRVLRDYMARYPAEGLHLIGAREIRDALTPGDVERVLADGLLSALEDAARSGELRGVEEASGVFRIAGVRVRDAQLLARIETATVAAESALRTRAPFTRARKRTRQLRELVAVAASPPAIPAGEPARQSNAEQDTRVTPLRRWSALLAVGGAAVVLGIAGWLVFSGGAPAASAAAIAAAPSVRVGAPVRSAGGLESAAVQPRSDQIAGRMSDARTFAARGQWDQVVDALSANGPALGSEQAVAWDSLLTVAAFRRAGSLPQGRGRERVLRLAYSHATRALDAGARGTTADELRLLRAEACLAGLPCTGTAVAQDLVLAARSPMRALSDRAGALLAERRR